MIDDRDANRQVPAQEAIRGGGAASLRASLRSGVAIDGDRSPNGFGDLIARCAETAGGRDMYGYAVIAAQPDRRAERDQLAGPVIQMIRARPGD